MRGEVRLDEGLYTVTIATEKQNLMTRPQYVLRVHMTDYQQLIKTVAVPLLSMLFAAWLGYKLIRSMWLRNWWAVLRVLGIHTFRPVGAGLRNWERLNTHGPAGIVSVFEA